MASLDIRDFDTLVADQVAAVQGRNSKLVDLQVGSVLRALVESNAGVALWQQLNILNVFAAIRAATSTGSDLDSWAADFGFAREAAVAATGQVTFSRYTATQPATIPVGSIVQTSDGTEQFAVIADTTNGAYNPTLGAYTIAANTSSVTVSVQALVAGAAGNVSANQINQLYQAISYVDTVTNAQAFVNGVDAESDDAFRTRLPLLFASLSKATLSAVEAAIAGVQAGLLYDVVENVDTAGNPKPGYFYAVIDDGTGSPPSSLLSNVYTAIDAVRPLTVTFNVVGPTVVTANAALTLAIASGYDAVTLRAQVQSALSAYIGSLSIGQTLPYTRIAQIAYGVSAGVTNVTAVTLNGGTSDLVPTATGAIRAGTITVS